MNTEREFTIIFWGRENGAIGITHQCRKTVIADSIESATLKLYDTHEHISNVREAMFSLNPFNAS